ncbi:MAG: hypothetical protein K2X77_01285 [Candidatus Obscuribacterales bacterium]|nr:hypothetical protein [Candidatus Obscuribacterales bacterium]
MNTPKQIRRAGALLMSVSSSFFLFSTLAVDAHDIKRPKMTPAMIEQRNKINAEKQPVGHQTLKEIPGGLPGPVLTSGTTFVSGAIIKRADGGKTTQLNFTSNQDAREIMGWYERSLRGDGWKVMETETKTGQPGWVIGSKRARTFVNVHFTTSLGSKKNKGLKKKGCDYTVTINQTKKALEDLGQKS